MPMNGMEVIGQEIAAIINVEVEIKVVERSGHAIVFGGDDAQAGS